MDAPRLREQDEEASDGVECDTQPAIDQLDERLAGQPRPLGE